MNQNLEEEKIRQLFLELREQDESRTPSFSAVLNYVQAPSREATYTWQGWRVAAVILSLLVISAAVFFLLRQSVTTQTGKICVKTGGFHFDTLARKSTSGKTFISTSPIPTQNSPVDKKERKIANQRRFKQSGQPSDALISKWQSPTEFLLQTPGAEWLRTLPNLNESILEMKILLPDGKNEW